MGAYVVVDNAGMSYRLQIKGDTPSQTELQRAQAFLAEKNAALPKPEEQAAPGGLGRNIAETGKAWLADVAKFPSAIAGSAGGIGDFLAGNERPGALSRGAASWDKGVDSVLGPAPGWEDSIARTLGSLGGMMTTFMVPGMGAEALAAKAAEAGIAGSKLTAAAKAAQIAKAGRGARFKTELGVGAVTGMNDARQRADAYEEQTGKQVDVGTRALQSIIGGALGTSFVMPVEKFAAPLSNLLKFVPAKEAPGVIQSLASRLKDAAAVGGVSAVQNAVYGLGQDLAEKGLYNKDLDPTQSIMANITAGGAIGGLLHFAIGKSLATKQDITNRLGADLQNQLARTKELEAQKAGEDTGGAIGAGLQGIGARMTRANQYEQGINETNDAIGAMAQDAAVGRAKEVVGGLGDSLSQLNDRNAYFAQGGEGRFQVKRNPSGHFHVEDTQGDLSGVQTGPKSFEAYATREEATAVAERMQNEAARADAEAARKANEDEAARTAAKVGQSVVRGGPTVPMDALPRGVADIIATKRFRDARANKDPNISTDHPVRPSELYDVMGKEEADALIAKHSPGGATEGMTRFNELNNRPTIERPEDNYAGTLKADPNPPEPPPQAPIRSLRDTPDWLYGDAPRPEPVNPQKGPESSGGYRSVQSHDKYDFSVGDMANAEVNGSLTFPEPTRIKDMIVDGDGKVHVSFDGSNGYVPADAVHLEKRMTPKSEPQTRGDIAPGTRVRFTGKEPQPKGGKQKKANAVATVTAYDPVTRTYTIESQFGKQTIVRKNVRETDIEPVTKGPAGQNSATGRNNTESTSDGVGGSAPPGRPPESATPGRAQQPKTDVKPNTPIDSNHPVMQRLIHRLHGMGLPDVALRVRRWIDDNAGVEGKFDVEGEGSSVQRVIELAEGHLKPGMTEAQIEAHLAGVMDHEVVHALKNMGLFKDAEWQALTHYVKNRYVPGEPYTYLQRSEVRNQGKDPAVIIEEAIADAFRDHATGDAKPVGAVRGLFARITQLFRRINDWLNPTTGGKEVMDRIRSGEIGKRPRDISTLKKSPDSARYSQTVNNNGASQEKHRRLTDDEIELMSGMGAHPFRFGVHSVGRISDDVARVNEKLFNFMSDELHRIAPDFPAIVVESMGSPTGWLNTSKNSVGNTHNQFLGDLFMKKFLMISMRQDEHLVTMYHELSHFAERLLTPDEYNTLFGPSNDHQLRAWANRYNIHGRYPGASAHRSAQESVAEAISHYALVKLRAEYKKLSDFFGNNPLPRDPDSIPEPPPSPQKNAVQKLVGRIMDFMTAAMNVARKAVGMKGYDEIAAEKLAEKLRQDNDARETIKKYRRALALHDIRDHFVPDKRAPAGDKAPFSESNRGPFSHAGTGQEMPPAVKKIFDAILNGEVGKRTEQTAYPSVESTGYGMASRTKLVDPQPKMLTEATTFPRDTDTEKRRLRYSETVSPQARTMNGEMPISDKTPTTPEQDAATLGARVRYALQFSGVHEQMASMRHAAAADVLRDTLEPLLRQFDKYKKWKDEGSRLAYTPYKPSFSSGDSAMPMVAKDRAAYYADLVVRKLANRMIGLARFVDMIKDNGGSVIAAYDAYMKHDAIVGKTIKEIKLNNEKMYEPLLKIMHDLNFKDEDITPLAAFSKVAREYKESTPYANNAALSLYLYAQGARERNAVMRQINPNGKTLYDLLGKKVMEMGSDGVERPVIVAPDALSGMSNAEADAILEHFANKPQFAQMLQAEKIVRDIIKDTNEQRTEGELIPSKFDFRFNEGPMAEAFRAAAKSDPSLAYLAQDGYRKYVPMKGFADNLDEDQFFSASKARGLQFFTRQDHRALGRTSTAANIIEHLLLQNEEAIMRKNYADVGRSFLRLLETNLAIAGKESDLKLGLDGMARIVKQAPMKSVLVNGVYQMKESTDRGDFQHKMHGPHVVDMVDPDFRKMLNDPETPYYAVRRYKLDEKGEVRRDENGRKVGDVEEVIVEIMNDNLRAALKGATGQGSGALSMVVDKLGVMSRFLANTVTSWNPEFMFSNGLRDVSEAMINLKQYHIPDLSKQMASHVIPSMKAIWKATPETQLAFLRGKAMQEADLSKLTPKEQFYVKMFHEFEADGGSIEFFGMRDLADKISHINNKFSDPGAMNTLQKSKEGIQKFGEFIEAYNKGIENSTRLSVYISLREALEKQGMSSIEARQHAAFASKNLTANFNRGGEWKQWINPLYMFYNAGIQGTWAMTSALKNSPKVRQLVGGIMVGGLVNDWMQSMISQTDPDGKKQYDKINDWVLEHKMIFMDPFGMSERGYFAIPMPYGYSMFFNTGRAMGKFLRGESDVGAAVGSIGGGVIGALNPITGSHSFLNFMAPTVVDPFVDLATNKNYQGRPITKEPSAYGAQAPNSQLHWNSTNPTSVSIAEWMNTLTGGDSGVSGAIDISPDTIDYMFGFITGSAGKFIARTTSTSWDAATGKLGDLDFTDIPVARQFVGNVSTRNDTEAYIEARQRILQPEKAVRSALEAGDFKTAANLRQRYADELRLAGIFKNADSQKNKLSTQLRLIHANVNIPDDKKYEMEKQLKKAIASHEQRAMIMYQRAFEQ